MGRRTSAADLDVAILSSEANLAALERALVRLEATRIVFPPFAREYIERGHSVHRDEEKPPALNIAPDTPRWSGATTPHS